MINGYETDALRPKLDRILFFLRAYFIELETAGRVTTAKDVCELIVELQTLPTRSEAERRVKG